MPAIDSTYRVALPNRLSRAVLRPIFRGLFRILAPVDIQGAEHVPYGKPYIAAINHVSTFDPPFMLAFWPENIEALGASDIWQRKSFAQAFLVRLYGATAVHRGEFDREAVSRVVGVLKAGYPLLMSPEGGRSHNTAMRQARPGLAFLVEQAGVPVVPVGIIGTTDDFFQRAVRGARPPLTMRIGQPLELPPVEGKGEARRANRQHNVDLVMAHIAGLLPLSYRGYYAASALEPAG